MKSTVEKESGFSSRAVLDTSVKLEDSLHSQSGQIHIEKLYLSYFLDLPSIMKFPDIKDRELLEHLRQEFNDDIVKQYSSTTYSLSKEEQHGQHIIVLREQIMVQVTKNHANLLYMNAQGTLLERIKNLIIGFYHPQKTNHDISVIISESGSLKTRAIEFKKPNINFQLNYNDDFIPVHKKAIQLLKRRDESGLFLFHGKPGTGKSTYLRYLIKTIQKKVLFISPKKAGNLEGVEVFKLLLDNKNTVLVIEDAEELMVSRNHERNSNLSTILSLTDGILGESLAIQM